MYKIMGLIFGAIVGSIAATPGVGTIGGAIIGFKIGIMVDNEEKR